MQYIKTKYLPNSNRIKATTSYGTDSIAMPYDYSLNVEQAHAKVAMALAQKLEWLGEYVAGGNETGYVFVIAVNSNQYSTGE